MREAELIKCIQCGEKFTDKFSYWDDSGYGYSSKLAECPNCHQLNIVKHVEDYGLDVNNDERWYER